MGELLSKPKPIAEVIKENQRIIRKAVSVISRHDFGIVSWNTLSNLDLPLITYLIYLYMNYLNKKK